MTFGEKLQALRKARGWSQEELASQIHVPRQALSKRYTLLSVLNTGFMVLLAAGGIGTIFYHPILRLWEKYGKRGE